LQSCANTPVMSSTGRLSAGQLQRLILGFQLFQLMQVRFGLLSCRAALN
jgi:hypothetical protein